MNANKLETRKKNFYLFSDDRHGKQGIIHRNKLLHDMAYDEAFENDSATDIDSPQSGADDTYDNSELQQVSKLTYNRRFLDCVLKGDVIRLFM